MLHSDALQCSSAPKVEGAVLPQRDQSLTLFFLFRRPWCSSF